MGGNHCVGARARHFHLGKLICCASLSLAVLATTGCAVSQDAKNGTRFALDTAALLGTELAQFTLIDNSKGTFRKLGDAYSLKLERFHKVIALGNARQADGGGRENEKFAHEVSSTGRKCSGPARTPAV